HQAAISRVCLEPGAIRHVNGVRGDIIDGGEIVVAKRSKIRPASGEQSAIGGERGERDAGRQQVRQFLQECTIFGLGGSRRSAALRLDVRYRWTRPWQRNDRGLRGGGLLNGRGLLDERSPPAVSFQFPRQSIFGLLDLQIEFVNDRLAQRARLDAGGNWIGWCVRSEPRIEGENGHLSETGML